MMERLVNLARGCFRVELTGASPANFLNRMAVEALPFWDARPEGEFTLRVTIHADSLVRARQLARLCRCELTVLAARGRPALAARLRRRAVLLIAAGAALLALFVSSLFIWRVEVSGTATVSRGELQRALSDCGVSMGTYWPGLNTELVRDAVILKLPQLSWLTVNVKGGRAQVLCRERTSPPVTVDRDAGYAVIARTTGVVERMSVLAGCPLVKAGDAVLAGETLISGVMTDAGGGAKLTHAMGQVWARTYHCLTMRVPLVVWEKTDAGPHRVRYALKAGDTRINIYRDSGNMGINCDKIICEQPVGVEGVFTLPLTLVREELIPYTLTLRERDSAALEGELTARLRAELLRRLHGGTIESSTVTSAVGAGVLTVTLRAECLEDIAEETEIVP